MLPHPWWIQAVISGLVMLQGYVVGLVAQGVRRSPRMRRVRTSGGRIRRIGGVHAPAPGSAVRMITPAAALTATGVAITVNWYSTTALDTAVGLPPASPLAAVWTIDLAVVVAIGLVLLGRAARFGVRRAARARSRWVGAAAAASLLLGGSAVPAAAQPGSAVTTAAVDDVRPGPRGRELLAGTPSAEQLRTETGRPAVDPIRVYAGLDSAGTDAARARAAVHELDRRGAFSREALLVAVPTGSGWVDPAAPRALERLYGGDTATVALQYSAVPSWIAYLGGSERAKAGARALLQAVRGRWLAAPPAHRPKLLVYGESLGVIGGLDAVRTVSATHHDGAGRSPVVDGTLWVGTPAAVLDQAARPDLDPSVGSRLLLAHPDDPVPVWSPRLAVLPSPRWQSVWLPGVSFWTSVADMVSVYWVPVGHGHRYGPEFDSAWARIALARPLGDLDTRHAARGMTFGRWTATKVTAADRPRSPVRPAAFGQAGPVRTCGRRACRATRSSARTPPSESFWTATPSRWGDSSGSAFPRRSPRRSNAASSTPVALGTSPSRSPPAPATVVPVGSTTSRGPAWCAARSADTGAWPRRSAGW
jgi:uncharacterized membrane protein